MVALPSLLPSGTVTLLFTDIEGSTRLLQHLGDRYADALAAHQSILRAAAANHGGHEVDTQGDSFFISFPRAADALAAAIEAQRALAHYPWPEGLPLRVRMGMHTGEPRAVGDRYIGIDVHRAARVGAAGHGGQVLLTQTTRDLIEDALPPGVTLVDLGPHRLKDLARPEHLFQLVIADLPALFPPLRTSDQAVPALPMPLTSLVGRETEIAIIVAMLRQPEVRLVTLTGSGGVGKTRLALQVATDLQHTFADGIFLVPLAALTAPDRVALAVTQALGIPEGGERPLLARLQEDLQARESLLILDNFEQVAGAAPLVAALLVAAPHLKALVTSRAALRISAEHEWVVPPLALPDPANPPPLDKLGGYAAVRLFVERAQAVRADFRLTAANAAAVAAICARLDGLPLALELAAARIKTLSPAALLTRLTRRLDVLIGGPLDLPERQRTLRGAVAWSHDLLTDEEQILFRRLAIFVGGGSLEAAEAVCNTSDPPLDVLEVLASLVDKSLVRQEERPDGELAFIMLNLIREYALEHLAASDEMPAIARAHAAYYLTLTEEAVPYLAGADLAAWLDRLEHEHGNLRAALDWALAGGNAAWGLRLAVALGRFWEMRGFLAEGRRALGTAIASAGGVPPLLRARALNEAGVLARYQGDFREAERLHDQALTLYRDLDDAPGMAMTLEWQAYVPRDEADYARALPLHEASLSRYQVLEDRRGITDLLMSLSWVVLHQGDDARARRLADEALTLHRELGDPRSIALAALHRGSILVLGGEVEAGRALLRESLATFRALGAIRNLFLALDFLAVAEAAEGRITRAARLWAAAEALRERIGARLAPTYRAHIEQAQAEARAALDEETWSAAWDAGRDMSLPEAIRLGLGEEEVLR